MKLRCVFVCVFECEKKEEKKKEKRVVSFCNVFISLIHAPPTPLEDAFFMLF
jgi:hypothetical protein